MRVRISRGALTKTRTLPVEQNRIGLVSCTHTIDFRADDVQVRTIKYSLPIEILIVVGSCALVSPNGVPADLEGTELYDWLGFEGIYDPDLDNDTVINILEKGLFSDDPDIVAAALNAINWYISWVGWDSKSPEEPRPLDRELQKISGLKALLVDTWQKGIAENPDFDASQGLDMVEIRNGRAVLNSKSVWTLIPNILAVLYPKDPDGYEIIWESKGSNGFDSLVLLLNLGEYSSKKDQELRISVVLDRNVEARHTAEAARGLGLFRSKEGLEALVSRLEESAKYHTNAVGHLVETVVEYGNDCLPYAELLRKTGRRLQIDEQIGVRYDRPRGYGVTPEVGKRYRIQVALEKLDELERAAQDLELKP